MRGGSVTPRNQRGRFTGTRFGVLASAVMLLSGCAPSSSASPVAVATPVITSTPGADPSPTQAPTAAATLRPAPLGSPDVTFDLRGTAWRLLELPGQSLTAPTTPVIEIGPFARGEEFGSVRALSLAFDGCSTFSFHARLKDGDAELNLDNLGPQEPCAAAPIRDAFVRQLKATTSWAVFGDLLVMTAPTGTLQFSRLAPPAGDPGRSLVETLRADLWRVESATGITTPRLYPPITFSDRRIGAVGDCGFGAELRIQPGGQVSIDNAGFDTTSCGANDQRPAFMALLGQVVAGAVESADRVRLTGPAGELVLARGLAGTFTTKASTLRFTADNGTAVTVDIRDGSESLTSASKGTPFSVTDPSDLNVWIIGAEGDGTTVRIEWVASGGCQPHYRVTIEPGVRRIWIEQLTPAGGDSLGGNCDITLGFSRPVPAEGIEGMLRFPD